jgi:hypothetical protein
MGHTTPPEAILQTPAEFGDEPAPDWVICWHLRLLPGGGSYRGRLLFWEETRTASFRVETPVGRQRLPVVTEGSVPDEAVEVLREILRTSFPDALARIPWQCRDGIPVDLVIHRRQPFQGAETFCNLCDVMHLLGQSEPTLVERWRAGLREGHHAPAVVPLACLAADLSFAPRHQEAVEIARRAGATVM